MFEMLRYKYHTNNYFSGVKVIIKNSKVPKYLSIVIDVYAIALWPFIFISDEGDPITFNHEKIHLRQQVELLIVGFYLLYALFWLKGFVKHRDRHRAYFEIPFEKEAYTRQDDFNYLTKRQYFSWINYL